jgi:hypothetical protein
MRVLAVLALIEGVMKQLRRAQEKGDAEAACEHVYVVREAKAGEEEEEGEEEGEEGGCRAAFEAAIAQRERALASLRTSLKRVDIHGEKAVAVLHTVGVRRDGSRFERDVPYDVVHTEKGWRVRIAAER